jgi:ATP/ADP translocase
MVSYLTFFIMFLLCKEMTKNTVFSSTLNCFYFLFVLLFFSSYFYNGYVDVKDVTDNAQHNAKLFIKVYLYSHR